MRSNHEPYDICEPTSTPVAIEPNTLFEYKGRERSAGRTAPQGPGIEAGRFANGKIIVAGRYDDFDSTFLFGGGAPEPEVEEFSGVTSEGWTLRSVGGVTSTNYLPRMREEGAYDAFRLNQLDCERLADAATIASVPVRTGQLPMRRKPRCCGSATWRNALPAWASGFAQSRWRECWRHDSSCGGKRRPSSASDHRQILRCSRGADRPGHRETESGGVAKCCRRSLYGSVGDAGHKGAVDLLP